MIELRVIVRRVAIALVVLLLAAAAGSWWWLRSSIPALDADWRLSGLRGPVEIASDKYGVPHAYARDAEDAWFIAGALHARDRAWQMELYRRATQGRLSEILGESTLPIDQRMLTLGIRAAAESEWSRVGPAARAALTRYAEGANAVLSGLQGRARPLEFQLLGISPAPWTPQDSLAVGRLLAFRLAENQGAELVRHALGRAIGPADADRLTGRYPDAGPTVLGELEGRPAATPAATPAPTVPPEAAPTPRASGPAPDAEPRSGPARRRVSRGVGLVESHGASGQQQRLGRGRHSHRHRAPHPGERSAPAHRDALGLVRDASRGSGPRRSGRVGARHPLRGDWPQRAGWLGLHQLGRGRPGLRARAARPRGPAGVERRGMGPGAHRQRADSGARSLHARAVRVVAHGERRRLRRRRPRLGIAAGVAHA